MANRVARDARIFAEARTAMRNLLRAGEQGATGQAIFGNPRWAHLWHGKLMRRLCKRNLVRRAARGAATGHGPPFTVYVASNELREVAEDNNALSNILWPSYDIPEFGAKETAEEEPRDITMANAELESIAQRVRQRLVGQSSGAPSHDDEPEEEVHDSLDAKLNALLQIQDVTMQNIVYMRERVDALTAEVVALRKAFE
jgi:hypothetical protein